MGRIKGKWFSIRRRGQQLQGASTTYRAVPRAKGESYQGRAIMVGWTDRSCGLQQRRATEKGESQEYKSLHFSSFDLQSVPPTGQTHVKVQRQESPLVKLMLVGWPNSAQVKKEQSEGLEGHMETGQHILFQAQGCSGCGIKA